jgi:high-affinity iron transporter
MPASFLIMVREGFEAALIVAIVLVYLRRIDRSDLTGSVWQGVALAAAISLGLRVFVDTTVGSFEGAARLRADAAIALGAVVVPTWMILWMQRQSRAIKGDLERQVDAAVASASGAARGLVAVAFLAVLREGIEAALFLVAPRPVSRVATC